MPENIPNPLSGVKEAAAFVQSYWQQRPVVIRGAISEQQRRAAPSTHELLRLTQSDLAETRLITRLGRRWEVEHGPFQASQLPTLETANWTALIQGVDLNLDSARALLDRFRFLPDARLDDLMISIAGDRGGVGPHVDNYDVFLLQLAGDREWQIAPPGDWLQRQDQPLKLVRNFKASETMRIGAGDMLYLPAGWAHNGIARGPCTTASIGFRAPNRAQLQSAWLEHAADQLDPDSAPFYRDPRTSYNSVNKASRWHKKPARIPPEMMASLTEWLTQLRYSEADMRRFVGCFLSEPNAQVRFDRPSAREHRSALKSMSRYGIVLNRQTRMLWHQSAVFINGEYDQSGREALPLLKSLANHRELTGEEVKRLLEPKLGASLPEWHQLGWIHPNNP